MSPPESLKVMHLVFRLRFVDADISDQAKADGWCSKSDLTITIREGLRPRLLCDTVVHEIVHACFFASGMHDEALTEEDVARQLTGPLLCVFSENPELVRWLQYLLHPEDVDDGAYV